MTLYRPHRGEARVPAVQELTRIDGGYLLEADLTEGRITALLPNDDAVTLSAAGLSTQGEILLQRRGADGSVSETGALPATSTGTLAGPQAGGARVVRPTAKP